MGVLILWSQAPSQLLLSALTDGPKDGSFIIILTVDIGNPNWKTIAEHPFKIVVVLNKGNL